MKKSVLGTFVLLCLLLLSSCNVNSYKGFPVEDNIILLPSDSDDSSFPMPLTLYRELESVFSDFSSVYNYFADVSFDDFERYRDLTIGIYSLKLKDVKTAPDVTVKCLQTVVESNRHIKKIVKELVKLDSNSLSVAERFVRSLSDYFDVLIYVIREIAEFDNNEAPWYESREALFNDAANDKSTENAISYIEKYFPDIRFVSNYKESGFYNKVERNS